MTDCPLTPSTADRLLQQHRPSWPVCSGLRSRKDGTKRRFPGLKPHQSLAQNLGSAAFTQHHRARRCQRTRRQSSFPIAGAQHPRLLP